MTAMSGADRIRARLAASRAAIANAEPPADASPAKPVQQPAKVPVPSDSNLHIRSVVPLDESDPYYGFRKELAEIEMRLNDESPNFGTILRDLHRSMAEDPNVVTVLSPEEIGIITKGLATTANVTISVTKKTSTRRTQQITVDDI